MAKVNMKVVMMGREYSGKTSLVERFLNERFVGEDRYQSTIGAAYGARTEEVGDRLVVLGLWDTAGSERYESMSRMYYRGSHAAIICYSVVDIKSWQKVKFWVSELRKMEEQCRVYICATKTDLLEGDDNNRVVDCHDATEYCEEIGAELFETSSKVGTNISEMFHKVASDYLESYESVEESTSVENRQFWLTDTVEEASSSSCCGKNKKL